MNPWPRVVASVTLALCSLLGPRSALSAVYWIAGLLLWTLPRWECSGMRRSGNLWMHIACIAIAFMVFKLVALFAFASWMKPIFPVALPTSPTQRFEFLAPDVVVCLVCLTCAWCPATTRYWRTMTLPQSFFAVLYSACGATSLSAFGLVYSLAGFLAPSMQTQGLFKVAAILHTSTAYCLCFWKQPNEMAMLLCGPHDNMACVQLLIAFCLLGAPDAQLRSVRRLSFSADQNEGLLQAPEGMPDLNNNENDADSENTTTYCWPTRLASWLQALPARFYNPAFGVIAVCFTITMLWPCVLTAPFLVVVALAPLFVGRPFRIFGVLKWYMVALLSTWFGYNVYAQAMKSPPSQIPQTYTLLESIGLVYFQIGTTVPQEHFGALYALLGILTHATSYKSTEADPIAVPTFISSLFCRYWHTTSLFILLWIVIMKKENCTAVAVGFLLVFLLLVFSNRKHVKASAVVWIFAQTYCAAQFFAVLFLNVSSDVQGTVGLYHGQSFLRTCWEESLLSLSLLVQFYLRTTKDYEGCHDTWRRLGSLRAVAYPLFVLLNLSLIFAPTWMSPVSADSLVFLVLFILEVGLLQFLHHNSKKHLSTVLLVQSYIAAILLFLHCVTDVPPIYNFLAKDIGWSLAPHSNDDSYPNTRWGIFPGLIQQKSKLFMIAVVIPIGRELHYAARLVSSQTFPLQRQFSEVVEQRLPSSARGVLDSDFLSRHSNKFLIWLVFFVSVLYQQEQSVVVAVRLVVIISLLFSGKHWSYAGGIFSLCSMGTILLQYACRLEIVKDYVGEDLITWWGFTWGTGAIAEELIIFGVAVIQQRVHDFWPPQHQASSTLWKIYGAHIASLLLALLAIYRVDCFSVVYILGACVFLLLPTCFSIAHTAHEPAVRTNGSWLRFFATCVFICILCQIFAQLWPLRDSVLPRPPSDDFAHSWLCSWYEESVQEKCGKDWIKWLYLTENTSQSDMTYDFIVLFIIAVMRRAKTHAENGSRSGVTSFEMPALCPAEDDGVPLADDAGTPQQHVPSWAAFWVPLATFIALGVACVCRPSGADIFTLSFICLFAAYLTRTCHSGASGTHPLKIVQICSIIRKLSMFFLLLTVAYQVPLTPCPVYFSGKGFSLSRTMCVHLEVAGTHTDHELPDEWYAWWGALFFQVAGVLKLNSGWSDVGGVAMWVWLVAVCSLLHGCAAWHYRAVMELEFRVLRERIQRIREMRFCDNIVSRRNVERNMQAAKHSVLLHRLVRVQKLTLELENIWNNKRPHFTKTEVATREREHFVESVALQGGDTYAASHQILHLIVQAYQAQHSGSGSYSPRLSGSSSLSGAEQTELLLSQHALFKERAVRYLKATRAHARGFITAYELEEEKRQVLDFLDVNVDVDAGVADEESPESSEDEKVMDAAVSTIEAPVQESDGMPSDAAHSAADLQRSVLRSILGVSWVQRATLFLSEKLEWCVTDTLFITAEHEALPQHRTCPSLPISLKGSNGAAPQGTNADAATTLDELRLPRHCWHIARKALLSSSLFFVTFSGILTFTAFPSIVSFIMAMAVVLFLAMFPFTPVATWSSLFVYTFIVILAKTLYQCPFISFLIPQSVLPLLFGMLNTSRNDTSTLHTTVGILWADYFFLIMLSLHIMALRTGGLHLHDRRTFLARLRESGTDAPTVVPPHATEATTERDCLISPAHAREGTARESKRSDTSDHLRSSHVPPLLPSDASSRGVREDADEHSVPSWVDRLSGAQVRKPACDLYGVRFFLSILVFLCYLFLWSGMAGGQTIQRALETNNFSASQVVVLLIQVMLMVSDRVLYTCHNSDLQNVTPSGKIHKQYAHLATRALLILQLLLLHGFMLAQIVRQVQSTTVGNDWADQISLWRNSSRLVYYVTYMAYLSVCSLQCAYDSTAVNPTRLFGLTEKTDVTSKTLFTCFTAVPYLQEFRVMADWTVTRTSMDWMAWFKLEDAMNNLYIVKCDMQNRVYGQARPFVTEKLLQGICFLIAMVLLLLAPILFFSTMNQLQSRPALITDGELVIDVTVCNATNKRSVNLYSSHQADIHKYTATEKKTFERAFPSVNLLNNELQTVNFPDFSDDIWMVSPPLKRKVFAIVDNYKQNNSSWLTISFELKYRLNRGDAGLKTFPYATKRITEECKFTNSSTSAPKPYCRNWVDALLAAFGTNKTLPVLGSRDIEINITSLYWPFIQLTDTATVEDLPAPETDAYSKRQLTLVFHPGSQTAGVGQACDTSAGSRGALDVFSSLSATMEGYWELHTVSNGTTSKEFSLDTASQHVSFGSEGSGSFSVIGLYLGVVLTIGRFLRYMTKDISKRVIYEEMREPDLFLDLGAGIYISRMHGDLHTETVLYQQLIKLFRSPEMLLYITGDASAQFRGSIYDAAETLQGRRANSVLQP